MDKAIVLVNLEGQIRQAVVVWWDLVHRAFGKGQVIVLYAADLDSQLT